jgi:RNA polymerase-binding transcription factor
MATDLPPDYQPSADEEFLNPRQVEYFRRRLEKAREDLRRELDAIPSPDANDLSYDGDQTDHASADSEREFEIQNRERVQMLLRQTERALARLENGTYGYCEDTGEPIGLKRLIAQPTTSLSLSAQEARERRSG